MNCDYDYNYDNNCLDLPSLTKIDGHDCMGNHRCIGHVFLESMI